MDVVRLLTRWLITAAALVVAAWAVPGIEVYGQAWIAVGVMALVVGLLNAFVKPVLQFLSCGCIVATLGLFLPVLNGLLLWLSSQIAQDWFGAGFVVDGFWPAFWGGIIVSVVSFVLSMFVDDREGTGQPPRHREIGGAS